MSVKIIAVTGINGNQGGSVASTFLNTPGWTVRGITRSIDSATSKDWSTKGVDMVQADLDKPDELIEAFRGAHAIFCVTNWWQELGVPGNWANAAQTGEDIRKICYDIEVQRGMNMVNAAAAVVEEDGLLQRLVLSVVPNTLSQSGGKIKDNYHFDAKWAWVCCCSLISTMESANVNEQVTHLHQTHPKLVVKTSLFQPGVFLNNWDGDAQTPFVKVSTMSHLLLCPRADQSQKPDGTMAIRLPVRPDAPMPFFHPVADSGRCVKALVEARTPQNLAAMGVTMSWAAVCEHLTHEFSEQKTEFVFEQISPGEFEAIVPGPAGAELSAMWRWIDGYGYYGNDETFVYPKDVSYCHRACLMSSNIGSWELRTRWQR
jgi:NmrA-like family